MKTVKLVNVSDKNNNKFYLMEEIDSSSWKATWGRVGSAGSSKIYLMNEWDKKYYEKLGKGYEDITELSTICKSSSIDLQIDSPEVKALIDFLQKCSKQSIKDNYLVDVGSVTQKQIEKAQSIIDQLSSFAKKPLKIYIINDLLLSLYKTIPRKMSDVKSYLLKSDDLDFFKKLLSNEQSLLDTLSTQVQNNESKSEKIEDLGFSIEVASDEDRQRIKDETDFNLTNHKVFKITNFETEKNMIKGKTKLLYHGSRNENWLSIIQNGLKIRPSGVSYVGAMFGMGIYSASKALKSIGYTSLKGSCWSNGSSNKAYLAIFEFNLGKKWNIIDKSKSYESWMSRIDLNMLKEKGFDSVFAKGGADLRNDEYIVYENNRCTIKYLIELTK
jgi:poly [ADP-ribose] polymerase 2/3/4